MQDTPFGYIGGGVGVEPACTTKGLWFYTKQHGYSTAQSTAGFVCLFVYWIVFVQIN